MLYPIQTVLFQEFPYHLNVNATLYCKYNTQRILTPGDLNWVQHWVGRIGLLFISGAFHYTEPTGQRPLGLTNGKWNASEPKLRPNWLFSSGVPRAAPHIRKCGNLPIRQNLVIMWPYTERASDRPSASQGNQYLLSHFVASWGAQEKTNCTSILWSIDSCQNRVSADEYRLTVPRAQVTTHRGRVLFCSYPLTNYQFQMIAGSSLFFPMIHMKYVVFMSLGPGTIRILISNWPGKRKLS